MWMVTSYWRHMWIGRRSSHDRLYERDHLVDSWNALPYRLLVRLQNRGELVRCTQKPACVHKNILQDEATWLWDAWRNKIKSLRVQYLRAKQQNNASGQEKAKFIFFEHIDKYKAYSAAELGVNAGAEFVNIDEENERSTGKDV